MRKIKDETEHPQEESPRSTRTMPTAMATSMSEKRRRNRSLTNCLCTPPPYPGYMAMAMVRNDNSNKSTNPTTPLISPTSNGYSTSSISSFPKPVDEQYDGEVGQRQRGISLISSGYGSAESDQETWNTPFNKTTTILFVQQPKDQRNSRRIIRHHTEKSTFSSRRRSVPAHFRSDAFPEDLVRVLISDGIVSNYETDADSGIAQPLLMDWRSINRPETVLELARKFGEVTAAQELERHRSRSSYRPPGKENNIDIGRSGSSRGSSASVTTISSSEHRLGGIASLSLNHHMSKKVVTGNIFKQLDQQQQINGQSKPSTTATVTRNPSSIKDALLKWCQIRVQAYPISITNFSSSWANGLAFCALIHRHAPNAFDFRSLDGRNRRFNFDLAFRVAEEQGVVPLLEVDDMLMMGDRPDWKCVFTYVQTIYKQFRDWP